MSELVSNKTRPELMLGGGGLVDLHERVDVHNPADTEEVAHTMPKGSGGVADRAIREAQRAFPQRSGLLIARRSKLLHAAAEAILDDDDSEECANTLLGESGKVLKEAHGEIAAGLRTLEEQFELQAISSRRQ